MRHIIAKYFKPSAARILLGAVLTMSASTALAANDGRTIHGKIVDADGKPVTGAIVNINEALRKTLTNENGNFTIKVKPGDDLYISYLGYKEEHVKVGMEENEVNVTLQEDKIGRASCRERV